MTFRVGQKVVCVDTAPWETCDSRLHIGAVYTLSDVRPFPCGTCGIPAVWLVEVECPIPEGWYGSLFRPAVERKTDITVFTEILRKASKPARGPVVSLQQGNTR